MNRFLSVGLAAIALGSPVLKAQTNPPDVAGLQTGMPLSAAKAKLGGLKVVNLSQKDPAVVSLVGYSDNEAWAFVAVNDKLAYIEHHVLYPNKATAPLYSEIAPRVKAKYGTDTGIVDYKASGIVVPAQGEHDPCMDPLFPGFNAHISVRSLIQGLPANTILTGVYLPTAFRSDCAETVYVEMPEDVNAIPGKTLVSRMVIRLIDQRPLLQETQRWQKSQQAPLPDDNKRAKPPL